jgi:hypothetical protein
MSARTQHLVEAGKAVIDAFGKSSERTRQKALKRLQEVIDEVTEPRDAEETAYYEEARGLARDGELEVDDDAVVSLSEDSDYATGHRGAYVEAWIWVDNPVQPEDEEADDDN